MMSPKNERARMFHATVVAATDVLDQVIDAVEIEGTTATVRSGGAAVTFELVRGGGQDAEGRILLGGGDWHALLSDRDRAALQRPRRRRWWRLIGLQNGAG